MTWTPTNEIRWEKRETRWSERGVGLRKFEMVLQQKWEAAVPSEHDGATGYMVEEWRDVPVVEE